MTVAENRTNAFVSEYESYARQRMAQDPSWLRELRQRALTRFSAVGFPNIRHEEWRYTNVAPIARSAFVPADEEVVLISPSDLAPLVGEPLGARLVFVNGRFNEALSNITDLPAGLTVENLESAWRRDPETLQRHYAQYAEYKDRPFVALNTAYAADGAVIRAARGKLIERAVQIVYVTVGLPERTAVHPRTLIIAEEDSHLAVVETHVGMGEGVYFSNPVTEIAAADAAVVDHYKLQQDLTDAYHVGTLQIDQQRSTNVRSHCLSFGGSLARNNISTRMKGEGGTCSLNGLYVLGDEQHVDNHLRVEHIAPHCDSRENFKGVLDGKSRGVFTGRIVVHPDAQKTDGKQSNMNLLLSDDAQVETKPQLEIFADDVKCTHGATVGQIDREAIFYLRSRGVPENAARSLLVYAFAGESLEQVRIKPLQERLRRMVIERLPGSEVFTQLVEG